MTFSDRAIEAIVTGAVGIALTLAARWLLRVGFGRYLRAIQGRRSADELARISTRLTVLRRVIVALLFAIVVWSVLQIFPATHAFARALLASGAVLALFAGLAFSAPLGNLGAGVLLALSQPVRFGDRITVSDVTGTVEEITLIHTLLLTDDQRRIYIPNVQLMNSVVVNRSIRDPRRIVSVKLPVALRASIEQARRLLLEAVETSDQAQLAEAVVQVTEVGERTAWLTLTTYAPADAPVELLAGELRERGLTALA
jgi:small-conductance mechanosensitive channel